MTNDKKPDEQAATATDENEEDDSGLDDLIESIEEINPFRWLLGKIRDE